MSVIYCTVDSTEVIIQGGSLAIYDRATTNSNTASFKLVNPSTEPVEGNDVQIYLDDTIQNLFSGIISTITREYVAPETVSYVLSCIGYWRLFDRRLVKEHYKSDLLSPSFVPTIHTVVSHIIDNFTDPAIGFTMNNIISYPQHELDILFNYRKPSDCVRELAEMEGYEWYIDKDKDIHFFHASLGTPAPLEITDANLKTYFDSLRIYSDYTQIRNTVYFQGGDLESGNQTVKFVGNGESRYWTLPYKPKSISLTVDGDAKILGRENIDADDGSFAYFYNYYDQTLFCAAAETTPANGIVLNITMKFAYPLIIRVDDEASQSHLAAVEGGDGVYEYVIKDNTVDSVFFGTRKAMRELYKWAFPRIEGSVSIVNYYGFKAGQKIVLNITNPDSSAYRYNDTYFITQVYIEDLGNNILRYSINFEGNYGD